MTVKISPSILASDYANLAYELRKIETADLIHVDVMDGHFVPNISIGAPVTAAIKKVCSVPFDVHLMISHPLQYVEDFAKAGADIICFHTECEDDIDQTIDKIHSLGKAAALAVKPNTPIEAVLPYLDKIAMVLVMTVEPGFGGQAFMKEVLPKVAAVRALRPDMDIEVDGGVNADTVRLAAQAGANVFVAGSAVFKSDSPAATIAALKAAAERELA